MIKRELVGLISTDEFLKVFQVVPKIIEVERVIERVVENYRELPKTRDVTLKK